MIDVQERAEQLRVLPLNALQTDARIQMRARRDDDAIESYAQAMKDGGCTKFPPLRVVHDVQQKKRWVWDGEHRKEAASQAGLSEFACLVRPGTLDDAIWLALSANKEHGVRRTNADKEKAVKAALRARPRLSNAAIAEHVGVDEKTVARHRAHMESGSEIPTLTSREGADGKVYNTAKVGELARVRGGRRRERACTTALVDDVGGDKDRAAAPGDLATTTMGALSDRHVSASPPSADRDDNAVMTVERSAPIDAGVERDDVEPSLEGLEPNGENSSPPRADDGGGTNEADERIGVAPSALPQPTSTTATAKQSAEPSRQALAGKVRRYRNAKKDAERDIKEALKLLDGGPALQIRFVEVQMFLHNALKRLKEVD